MPSCGKGNSRLSNSHPAPNVSDVTLGVPYVHDEPAVAGGCEGEPESSSHAPGTGRVYRCFGPVPSPVTTGSRRPWHPSNEGRAGHAATRSTYESGAIKDARHA